MVVLTFCFFAPASASAQEALTFEQLQMLVKPGDSVYVTDASGVVTKGKVGALSPAMLRLISGGTTKDLSESDVMRIRQWRRDSLKNGALIGGGIGFGLTLLAVVAVCRDSWNGCGAGGTAGILIFNTGLFAAIAVGVDALIPTKQTVFIGRPKTSSRFHVNPILSTSKQGVALILSF